MEDVLLEPIRPFLDRRTRPIGRDTGEAAVSDSIAVIRNAPTSRPFVVAQLGQSLDGRIATVTGESRWISGSPALDHLHRIRAAVDAVVIGVGTAIADDPQLTVRRAIGQDPARVIIDPNCRLTSQAKCLRPDGTRRIIIRRGTTAHCSSLETIELDSGTSDLICPNEIANKLFAAGLKKILIEGGARTISSFIDAGSVDRLHLMVAPVIIGSGQPGLELGPIQQLSSALRPKTTAHVLEGGEVLFDCDLRQDLR